MNKSFKFPLIGIMIGWYLYSRLFISDKNTFIYWGVTMVLYGIGCHWVYAYIFNVNMHNHIGLIKPNEAKGTRFFSFMFGIVLALFVTISI
jgi:hypothetical protein